MNIPRPGKRPSVTKSASLATMMTLIKFYSVSHSTGVCTTFTKLTLYLAALFIRPATRLNVGFSWPRFGLVPLCGPDCFTHSIYPSSFAVPSSCLAFSILDIRSVYSSLISQSILQTILFHIFCDDIYPQRAATTYLL